MSTDSSYGLTISGGGTKSLAALAIVEKLLSRGISFSSLSGTSAGAVVTAYLACYGEVKSLTNKLLGIKKRDWIKFADASLTNRQSLIKGERFLAFFKELYGDLTFADLKIPLTITATNLKTGEAVHLRQGLIVDAVMASSSYPGVFPPYKLNNNYFVDGGVVENLPYKLLLEEGDVAKVIAINLASTYRDDQTNFNTTTSVITRSFELMMSRDAILYKENDNNLFTFSPHFTGKTNLPFGFTDLDKKYQLGKEAYSRQLEDFDAWLTQS